jgi:hypothetical protein
MLSLIVSVCGIFEVWSTVDFDRFMSFAFAFRKKLHFGFLWSFVHSACREGIVGILGILCILEFGILIYTDLYLQELHRTSLVLKNFLLVLISKFVFESYCP